MTKRAAPCIRIGTSGFSFKDWKGVVYPKTMPLKDALIYYQDELGFDCVEINATYYALVATRSFEGMERKTGPGFRFVVKAYKGITHDPFDPRLKGEKPTLAEAADDARKFLYSLSPLREAGKLGAVLLQFPVFFFPSAASHDYLARCGELFDGVPLVVEFRNIAWAKPETFAFLRDHGLAYCVVDEPRLPRLMPFINEVTAPVGYLRFHGRNRNWFNVPVAERYHYLYSHRELETFIPEIDTLARRAKETYIFFNNCHAGLAAKNAMTLRQMLGLPSATRAPELSLA
jgi:uncharacterized protein YecE (DUF72 family)